MRSLTRVRRINDAGLVLQTVRDRPVDLCIDGRRVWTLWTRRDTEPLAGPLRRVAWPGALRRHLVGTARFEVRDSATGERIFDRRLTLGGGHGPIEVRNRAGVDLGIDKSGRLVPTFAGRTEDDIAALLDATEAVIAALRVAGVEPFLAYGTLLGAVREGAVLGHDSDADLGYVSRGTNPVDVVRESFHVQRQLAHQGWDIARYSGAAFKIFVTEGEVTRGLDVFGGFWDAERLYLMGEIGVPFDRDWILPLRAVELNGRSMPVPNRPEKLLEATYGPGWKVPDPAFKFTTPRRTTRALDDWFRGQQPNVKYWKRRARSMARKPLRGPSPLARLAGDAAVGLGAEVLDIGAGRGADSLWLAQQGLAVISYDFVPAALDQAGRRAEVEHLDLDVRYLNLTEWRSVYVEGAQLARDPRPRVVLARHVLDATSGAGRESLARLCSMAMREGGQLFAEFRLVRRGASADWMVGHVDLEAVTTLLRAAGASSLSVTRLSGEKRPTVRVVGVW